MMSNLATACLFGFHTLASAGTSEQATKPHVIFMLADDLGHNNVGWRNPEISTPTLDDLHRTGVDLSRLYTFKYCSPTRSSIMSGRLPLHVTQNNKNNLVTNPGGADLRMTLLPERLRDAGYRTAMTGKWHVGARSTANLPINRGFDTHFGFLKGGENHMTQKSGDAGLTFVDLFRGHKPAVGEDGVFSTYLYAGEAIRVIKSHSEEFGGDAFASRKPLFMYLAWHAAHTPLQAPDRFKKLVPDDYKSVRSDMNALVSVLDEGVRNVTDALKETGMWNSTLIIFQADNGGWTVNPNLGGNNWPLRGGKVSDWEGGVRATGLLNGGWLDQVDPGLRGSVHSGYIHAADWYATLCHLAGIEASSSSDASAVASGDIPALDSVNVWDSLRSPNVTLSARTEVPLAFCSPEAECDSPGGTGDHALIQGRYKLVNGSQGGLGWWQSPLYPNASSESLQPKNLVGCPQGCLFDIFADPTEQRDIKDDSDETRAVFKRMMSRLFEIGKTVYQTAYSGGYDTCEDPKQKFQEDGGYLVPRCFNGSLPPAPTLII